MKRAERRGCAPRHDGESRRPSQTPFRPKSKLRLAYQRIAVALTQGGADGENGDGNGEADKKGLLSFLAGSKT